VRWWTRAFGGDARAPRDADAALRAALLAALDRDLERAERLLRRAAELDGQLVEPHLGLARLFRLRGEIGRAIRIHQNLLLRADLRTPEGVAILADLAQDFRQGGFLRRAIASFEEVLAHDARHLEALRALVRLLADVREFPRAVEMARRLARLEGRRSGPDEARLYVEMAETARAEGRSRDARRAARRALRRDRGAWRAWQILGALEAERGRTRAALAAWLRVPEIDPARGPEVFPQLEATFAALGRAREFETWLRGLLEKRPDDARARLALGRTLAARGDVDEAVAELRRLIERAPEDLEARSALGRILLSERRDGEATAEYAELLDWIERRAAPSSAESLA
jgi:lipopolysaccharide biosynthesis regulator YciM